MPVKIPHAFMEIELSIIKGGKADFHSAEFSEQTAFDTIKY